MGDLVGRVRLPGVTIALGRAAGWSFDPPGAGDGELAARLDALTRGRFGPADGDPAARALAFVAGLLDGDLELAPTPADAPAGLTY